MNASIIKKLSVITCGVLLTCVCLAQEAKKTFPGTKPKDGFVPTEEVAIAIALAVSKPIFGEEKQKAQSPFSAKLSQTGIWTVTGSLKKMTLGGTITVEIRKDTGAIERVYHTR